MYSQPFSLLRLLVMLAILVLFLVAQRYWFLQVWRLASGIRRPIPRGIVRGVSVLVFLAVALVLVLNFTIRRRDIVWRHSGIIGLVGLWVSSTFFAYLGVRAVAVAEWGWRKAVGAWAHALGRGRHVDLPALDSNPVDPGRRKFIQAATVMAGAIPLAGGAYGFVIGRRRYQVHDVEMLVRGLPPALERLRIAQLSDFHIGSYMSAAEIRRAVEMANDFGADVAVVTGDFITGTGDPLEACIAELARLHAPLGVWGCNGNHEIYAGAQDFAARMFARHGMHLLRQQNVELVRHGQALNLIGVDYQRSRGLDGRPLAMLADIASLVRRDMPNILLSHNPNAFPRAAELGIELMLAGHTHGGQVKVEILDRRVSPARFLTRYVAGPYSRPLGAAAALEDQEAWVGLPGKPSAALYVNRGLGTIGAPIRLGVPPEITRLTLRRA